MLPIPHAYALVYKIKVGLFNEDCVRVQTLEDLVKEKMLHGYNKSLEVTKGDNYLIY